LRGSNSVVLGQNVLRDDLRIGNRWSADRPSRIEQRGTVKSDVSYLNYLMYLDIGRANDTLCSRVLQGMYAWDSLDEGPNETECWFGPSELGQK
jgi:hypothetical protein